MYVNIYIYIDIYIVIIQVPHTIRVNLILSEYLHIRHIIIFLSKYVCELFQRMTIAINDAIDKIKCQNGKERYPIKKEKMAKKKKCLKVQKKISRYNLGLVRVTVRWTFFDSPLEFQRETGEQETIMCERGSESGRCKENCVCV